MGFADRIYREKKDGEPYFWPNEQEDGYLNRDYFGGDFEGIRQKLPYLANLGVTCIYLNPIFEAHSNHRYNTADYLKPDPLLGTAEEFTRLCAEAKERGIRIILDGVFSHTGSDSLYFNREGRYGPGGAYRDRNSPYRSWYDFDSGYNCGYRSWWGFESLPEVQEDDPSYVNFICGKGGVIDTWLNRGASGFRLDVADELPDEFIEKIRAAVKSHGNDKLLIGEVWEDATTKEAFGRRRTYLRGHGLDTTMNYPFRNLTIDFVRGADAAAVADGLMDIVENYPKPAVDCLMNFLSTHDTERAMTAISGEPANGRDRYWQSGPPHPRRPVRRGHPPPAAGLRHDLYAARRALHLLRRRDRHAGIPGPLQPRLLRLDQHRATAARAVAQPGRPAQKLRRLPRRGFEIVRAEGDLLQYRRIGRTRTAEIVLNRGPHLLAVEAFGKTAEVNPGGFTVLVEENEPTHVGYFAIY